MGIGSNRSRTGKPATLCELRTRMRDLDQSSRITIPASGFWKCRIKRPDRRAHSIPSSYGKFSSCIAGGNHRREISVLPPNPHGAFGVNRKTLHMPAARLHIRAGVRQTVQAGGPPGPLPRRGQRAKDVPLAGACLSARRARCDSTGAGRRRSRRQECRRPKAGNSAPAGARRWARGTECVDHDRAAHYLLSGGLAVRTSRLRLSLENSHVKSLKARFFVNQPS